MLLCNYIISAVYVKDINSDSSWRYGYIDHNYRLLLLITLFNRVLIHVGV